MIVSVSRNGEIEIRNALDFYPVTFSCSTFLWNIVLAFVVTLVRVLFVFASHGSSPVNSIFVDCVWGGVRPVLAIGAELGTRIHPYWKR